MTRTYAVKYKSKSKMLTTPEQVAQTEEDIKALALVKDAVIKEDGQVVTVEVENEDRLWTEQSTFSEELMTSLRFHTSSVLTVNNSKTIDQSKPVKPQTASQAYIMCMPERV